MSDIARLAGVSPAAVSFALNNRPGVSEETRDRILTIARGLGWFPNMAARALTGAGTGVVGLVLTRPARSVAAEPFYMAFIAGVESTLSASAGSLLLHIAASEADEIATYRRWAAERRIDGLILMDIKINDVRPAIARELALPTVALGHPRYTGGLASIWADDAVAIDQAVDRLTELGHRRLARVSERDEMAHTTIRNEAFFSACHRNGIETPLIIEADASGDGGRQATIDILREPRRPTAIIYDNDVMAVAGIGAARALDLSVPDDVSLLAYDDSTMCEVTHPPLSALSHDVYGLGVHAARALQEQLSRSEAVQTEMDAPPTLIERGSTAIAPTTSA